MKAKELIEELTRLGSEHGDLPVTATAGDEDITKVTVLAEDMTTWHPGNGDPAEFFLE